MSLTSLPPRSYIRKAVGFRWVLICTLNHYLLLLLLLLSTLGRIQEPHSSFFFGDGWDGENVGSALLIWPL